MKFTRDAVLVVGDTRVHLMARLIVKPASRTFLLVVRALRKHASGVAFVILMAAASEGKAQEADGERLFRHAVRAVIHSRPDKIGQVRRLPMSMGGTAGGVEGARYSPALRDSNVVWNAGRIPEPDQ